MGTAYHAKYFAHTLTQHKSHGGVERLSPSLFDACVDLNPHQIDAALFALRSPLSKGVILADEVGLGKTIEAGLLLCQLWSERKRRLLIICPASLRKQWSIEMEEKFNLPSTILDASTARIAMKNGAVNPFDVKDAIVITSFHYASRMQSEIKMVNWHLAVIDEAHKLRNVYKPRNKIGKNIKWALEDCKKVLLTATPLQNNLVELYGLASLIDERIFGDVKAFRVQYTAAKSDLDDLKIRLTPFCQRTLRSQVLEYIRYTKRNAITEPFVPTDDEQGFYEAVSEFLSRDDTYAIPHQQKQLTTLVLRKLLASSSRAITGTLETMLQRLKNLKEKQQTEAEDEKLLEDLDIYGEYLDEGFEEESEIFAYEDDAEDDEGDGQAVSEDNDAAQKLSTIERYVRRKLQGEIDEIENFIKQAKSIQVDTKARSLLTALEKGFSSMEKSGASRKALIFTESRRTQDFLREFLEANGYQDKIVLFNGTNNDDIAKQVYKDWLERNTDTGRITRSRAIDVRSALVEYFHDIAEIMIATEAGAEGINLQFCSLVINYDLPWNPQRIEQRIGRCHRYGQKYDVVVINFLNKRNEADRRVHQLLEEKFKLFSGVFGASDEVLGSLESGVDFEKRILEIYQKCRHPKDIDAAFDRLQEEMDAIIQARMTETRATLLEHFDEDVHSRLKAHLDESEQFLDRFGRMFWTVTKSVLANQAKFDDDKLIFMLDKPPKGLGVQSGVYHMISKTRSNQLGRYLYRPSHPLGEYVLDTAKGYQTPPMEVTFDITNHPARISVVEDLKGRSGYLTLQHLRISSFDDDEFLLFTAFDDHGGQIDPEVCEKLFNCDGTAEGTASIPISWKEKLEQAAVISVQAAIDKTMERNQHYFNEERDRLDKWVNDVELAAEKELKDNKSRIKALQREARQTSDLVEQRKLQEKIRILEKKQRKLRRDIFDIEDEVAEKRDQLIENLKQRMEQDSDVETLFSVRWRVS